ncbi:MAG: response regulator transcription factor [Saprospiraceae bacterium]|nr:response regulator transcription factor [Candidatus Defluviibacterium haderslevense]
MLHSNKIKIAVVDDHELFRTGLLSHLSIYDDLDIVINVENGNELLNALETQTVDLVLMDISLPDINGIDVTKILKEKNNSIKIIMLTGHELPSYVTNSIEAKANGYLVKSSKASEIHKAIVTVINGDNYYNEQVKNIIASDVIRKHNIELNRNNHLPTFSEMEIELLKLIRAGSTSLEISKKLFKSKRTIDEYRSILMKKTNTNNSYELIYYCITNKIFDKLEN